MLSMVLLFGSDMLLQVGEPLADEPLAAEFREVR